MKIKTILCAVFTAALLGSCSYDDGNLWDAVNGQEERISALEKWQKTVVERLNSLQGILTATDYVTGVDKVTKEDGTEGFKISFLHAAPITLYYNKDNEVSGTGDGAIGVDKGDDGKWFWTLNGEPLKVDGKIVYVTGGDNIKVTVNTDGTTDLTIGNNVVTIPETPITHPITGVTESGNVVTITLGGDKKLELPKYVDLSKVLQEEYEGKGGEMASHSITIPEGYLIKMLDATPAGWGFKIEGTGAATKLNVTYPSTGETAITFVISDGKNQTALKMVVFKAVANPGMQWTTIAYDDKTIVVPEGATNVKVTGTYPTSKSPNDFNNEITTPLKNSNVVNIDLSGISYTKALPANGFLVNTITEGTTVNLDKSGENNTIETVIVPSTIPNIFDRAFAKCKALKSVTINTTATIPPQFSATWFAGCNLASLSIFVPTGKVDTYKNSWDSSLKECIKPIPAE